MRWFKHLTDTRNNPKFRAIEKKFGEAGYARAFKLFEIVAERGGRAGDFSPTIDLRKPPTDLDWLAEEWKISNDDAKETLDFFSDVRLIDQKAWRRKIVEVPQMLEYMDEWTQRQQRVRNSKGTPEQLPSDSGKSRGRAEAEKEKEAEAEQSTAATAAATSSPKDKGRKILKAAWEAIGIEPLGHPICGIWEYFYTEYAKSEQLSAAMERAIQHCQENKVRLPRSFYDAKHLAEEAESAERFPEAWEVVGIKPCGSLKFVLAWERIYGDSLADEDLSVTMELAVKDCEASGIKVPSQFLAAKRGIKEKEPVGVPKTPEVDRSQRIESIGTANGR